MSGILFSVYNLGLHSSVYFMLLFCSSYLNGHLESSPGGITWKLKHKWEKWSFYQWWVQFLELWLIDGFHSDKIQNSETFRESLELLMTFRSSGGTEKLGLDQELHPVNPPQLLLEGVQADKCAVCVFQAASALWPSIKLCLRMKASINAEQRAQLAEQSVPAWF